MPDAAGERNARILEACACVIPLSQKERRGKAGGTAGIFRSTNSAVYCRLSGGTANHVGLKHQLAW
jgi:hypothetical protein